jgi:ribosomal protein S27AE
MRAKRPERIKANIAVNNAWRAEDRRRSKAHKAVAKALRLGQISRQPCCRCGDEKSLAHHDDYDEMLNVMWLCQPCHKQRHKELKEMF